MSMPEILLYPFMQRALLGGVVLAVLFAFFGVFVLLRKMAFFADGIAHASMAGVAVGILFSVNPLLIAVLASVVFATLIFVLEKKYGLASDTVIGIIFTSGLALGILIMSLQPGYQPDLITFLFGNILTIRSVEIVAIVILSVVIVLFLLINFRKMILVTLDSEMAQLSGVRVLQFEFLLYVLLAVAVVLGIKMLGIILVSALLIIPVATAKLGARSFRSLLMKSVLYAEVAVLGGLVSAYYLDLPPGPAVVLIAVIIFVTRALLLRLF